MDLQTYFIIGASIITGLVMITGIILTLGLRAERRKPDKFQIIENG